MVAAWEQATEDGESVAFEGRPLSNYEQRPSNFRRSVIKNNWDNAADGTQPNSKKCSTCDNDVYGNPYLKEKRNGTNGWHLDHDPKWNDRDLNGMDRLQIINEYNSRTRLRCIACNVSDNQ